MKAFLITSACAAVVASAGACAVTTSVFNPDGLADVQLAHVTNVCQTVMGLSPKERLIGGEWRSGGERLDYWTSHYRGCVTSLSDSMVRISDLQANRQADSDCRARGYASGSSDLALCVQASKGRPRTTPTANSPTTLSLPVASGSFFYARAAESRRREENACAAIGLEPGSADFNSCVKSLNDTFFAMDNPIS
jgi:hypothetical protein